VKALQIRPIIKPILPTREFRFSDSHTHALYLSVRILSLGLEGNMCAEMVNLHC
jgi:hypothetical protein